MVERVASADGVEPEVRLTEVRSELEAERMRFLGSPTVRENGRDVEPGADERDAFVFGCRVYRTPEGLVGQPAAEWVRAALAMKLRVTPPERGSFVSVREWLARLPRSRTSVACSPSSACHNRAQLVALAHEVGLVTPGTRTTETAAEVS